MGAQVTSRLQREAMRRHHPPRCYYRELVSLKRCESAATLCELDNNGLVCGFDCATHTRAVPEGWRIEPLKGPDAETL
jgi:hypothetical protein